MCQVASISSHFFVVKNCVNNFFDDINSDRDKDRVAVVTELSDAVAFFSQIPFDHILHQKWLESDVVNVQMS